MNSALLKKPLCLCLLAGSINLLSQTAAMAATGVTVTPASGGGAISADTASGGGTSLTGPVLAESSSGQIGMGSIVLDAPSGFVFDAGTTPVVTLTAGDNLAYQVIQGGTVLPSVLLGSPASPTPGWQQWSANINVASGNEMMINAPTGGALVHRLVLTVVPEPATMLAGAMLLVPFGLSTWCALRRRKSVGRRA